MEGAYRGVVGGLQPAVVGTGLYSCFRNNFWLRCAKKLGSGNQSTLSVSPGGGAELFGTGASGGMGYVGQSYFHSCSR